MPVSSPIPIPPEGVTLSANNHHVCGGVRCVIATAVGQPHHNGEQMAQACEEAAEQEAKGGHIEFKQTTHDLFKPEAGCVIVYRVKP